MPNDPYARKLPAAAVLPFTTSPPAMLNAAMQADPGWDYSVATVRGICVEYVHYAVDGVDFVAVLPEMGIPTFARFPTWVSAHDYVCDTARADVLAEIGHACPALNGADTYGATCERCA